MDASWYDQMLHKKPSNQHPEQEEKSASRFLTPLHMTEPLADLGTMVDHFGKLLVWYLPGALSLTQQVTPDQLSNIPQLTFY